MTSAASSSACSAPLLRAPPQKWVLALLACGGVGASCWLACRAYMQRRAHLVAVERQRRIDEAHKAAMDKEETGYLDPETGLWVFTALQHLNRGYCCGSGCRHCPYEHMNVPSVKKAREEREQAAKVAKGTKSPIFTGTGDKGMSSLGTGERKSKGETVFQIMGTLDELNAQLGMVRCSVARHTGYTHKDGEAQYAKLVRQV